MKVLFVLGEGGFGGIERHVQGLLGRLDRGKVDPVLCVIRQAGPISDEIAASGVRTYVLGARNGHDPRILPAFLRLLGQEGIDLVHAHELPAMVSAAMWLRPRIPLISSMHCALYEGLPSLGQCRFLSRTVEKRVNLYLPVSRATWEAAVRLLGLAPERGRVFHNPIDLDSLPAKEGTWLREELGLAVDTPLVGMVGRMVEQKDWPAFLAICQRLAEWNPRVHFVAAGDGPLREQLEASPIARSLSGRLHWLGFRTDARRIIGALDIFLLTSHHEELPTTLLEAFGMRTPVVGFLPVGGTGEVLSFGSTDSPLALLSQVRDIRAVADNVQALLNHPVKAEEMVRHAFAVVREHFDAKGACARLAGLYANVVAKQPLTLSERI